MGCFIFHFDKKRPELVPGPAFLPGEIYKLLQLRDSKVLSMKNKIR